MKNQHAAPSTSVERRRLKKCPVCKSGHDGHLYEPDFMQVDWGYPSFFMLCKSCACPLIEVGNGHCREFEV
jgi:hypothetical protein